MALKNRGGFLLSDTRLLGPLHDEILHEVSRLSGHTDEVALLRRVRVLSFWLLATTEAALCESDPEADAMNAIDRDLARILAERKSDLAE